MPQTSSSNETLPVMAVATSVKYWILRPSFETRQHACDFLSLNQMFRKKLKENLGIVWPLQLKFIKHLKLTARRIRSSVHLKEIPWLKGEGHAEIGHQRNVFLSNDVFLRRASGWQDSMATKSTNLRWAWGSCPSWIHQGPSSDSQLWPW